MKETVDFLAHHGYWLLVAAVLGRQACLPLPANLLLLAAGALAHTGELHLAPILASAVVTLIVADLAWYEAVRRWGNARCTCSAAFPAIRRHRSEGRRRCSRGMGSAHCSFPSSSLVSMPSRLRSQVRPESRPAGSFFSRAPVPPCGRLPMPSWAMSSATNWTLSRSM